MGFCSVSRIVLATLILSAPLVSAQQPHSTTPQRGRKVCVAGVANSSGVPIFTERVKARLVEELTKGKLNAVSVLTATLLADHLDLSFPNRKALRAESCDYMLLTEVAKLKPEPDASQPTATDGSPDAKPDAGPATGSEGQLTVEFALFHAGEDAPVLSGSVPTAQATHPTDATLAVMARISEQVKAKVGNR